MVSDNRAALDDDKDDIQSTLKLDSGHRSGRGRKWFWRIAGLIVLVIVAVFFIQSRKSGDIEYRTVAARTGNLNVSVTATGKLQPVNKVDVGSEVSGNIEAVLVDFNDHVKARDVLARLDTAQLEAKVAEARAGLAATEAAVRQAEATVKEAKAKFARARSLSEKGFSSVQDLETQEAAYDRAVANVAAAEAQVTVSRAALEAIETNLDKAVIRSPIDGTVLSRLVEEGQTVAATFQTPVLFTLAEDLRQMRLHADIDEADVGQVREGQSATFTVDAFPERQFSATVTQLRNSAYEVQGVVTYEGILTLDNPDLILRPGMTATAEISTATRENVLMVPNGALRFTPPDTQKKKGGPAVATTGLGSDVWVLQDGNPVPVPVVKGASDGQWTEILSGDVHAGQDLLVDVVRAAK